MRSPISPMLPAEHGEVVQGRRHRAPVDGPERGDDAVGRRGTGRVLLGRDPPLGRRQHPQLLDGPGVEQEPQALPRVQLPPAVLALDPLGAAHLGLPGLQLGEPLDRVLHCHVCTLSKAEVFSCRSRHARAAPPHRHLQRPVLRARAPRPGHDPDVAGAHRAAAGEPDPAGGRDLLPGGRDALAPEHARLPGDATPSSSPSWRPSSRPSPRRSWCSRTTRSTSAPTPTSSARRPSTPPGWRSSSTGTGSTSRATTSPAPSSITHHHVARLRDTKQSRICAHMKLATSAGLALPRLQHPPQPAHARSPASSGARRRRWASG